jgi:glutamine cyclotransferase
MNFVKILIVAFSFIMISCGTKPNPQYSLKITKSSDFLKNGEKIKIHINNPKKQKLENVQFKINDSLINSTYTLNNKLGKNQIQVSFLADNKNYSLTKEIIIFSSIKPKLYSYEIINEFDHDIASYTQGLEFDNEFNLYESTGQYGYSSLRKIDFKTGTILNKLFLDKSFFGEGLTVLGNNIFQLTWKQKMGFVYNKNNFELIKSFDYNKSIEGWGLCNDGKRIYKSDGSEKIWILDPETLNELSFISIVTDKKVITKINELEWYNGKIYANTYQFNKEVGLIIDPKSGSVEGVIDFKGLKQKVKQHKKLDVQNGIAFHKKRNTFFVTGKNWSKLFEIKIFKN